MLEPELRGALISLLLGLLLGLERQRSQRSPEALFAGVRTFPMLVLLGFLATLAGAHGQPLTLPATLLAVAALAVAAYVRSPDQHLGTTTEALALLAPLLGALVAWGQAGSASALAVLVTLLLTLKAPLHDVAGRLSEDELLGVLKFAVVAVIVLPLLPTTPLGPYEALVPRHVGIVVAVLSGVSLLGYALVRVLGGRTGWALAGALGGLVSSTSVTLGFAAKARSLQGQAAALALGIVLASTVLYVRSLVLILLFDRALGLVLAVPLGVLFLVGVAVALRRFRALRSGGETGTAELGNPVELGRAVGLALMFAAMLVLARAAQANLGASGLLAAGLFGGLVDVDAVAMTVARLHGQGLASNEASAAAFLLATVANLLVKGGMVLAVGGGGLARRVLPVFAVWVVLTLAWLPFLR